MQSNPLFRIENVIFSQLVIAKGFQWVFKKIISFFVIEKKSICGFFRKFKTETVN